MFKLPWEFDNAKEGKDSKSTANNNIKIDPEAPSPVNEQEHPSLNTGAWGDLSPCNDSASPNSDAPLISSNIIVKEGEVSTNINNTGTVASRISACILPEVPDANRTSSSQLSPVVTQPASVKTEGIDENAKGESPLQILKNPTLWLFTITFILQQGLTYITNLSTILTAAAPESLQQDPLALQTYISLHVTIMSVCQSIGPIIGILPGLLEIILARFGKKWTPPEPDQSIALMLDEFLFLIPHLLLALVPNPSPAILILCTVLIGTGTGMASMIFPTLTRDLFGTKYYGTACGFVLGGVPIGILSSNEIYGYFLDKQTAQQYSEIASSNSSNDCYGSACFSKYFAVAVGIQFVALSLSIALYFIKRSRDRKAKLRVTSEGQHMNK